MTTKRICRVGTLMLGLVAVWGDVNAAGFQRLQQNASGLGLAYAGSAAIAEDASTVFYNPAGLTRLPARQFALVLAGSRDSIEFRDGGSTNPGAVAGGNGGNAGDSRGIAAAYFSFQLTPDLVLGVGAGSPFGTHTEYDANWVGRYQAQTTDIKSVALTPALAWRATNKLSLGVGVTYQRLEAEFTAVETTPALESPLRIRGSDSAWGGVIGATYELSPRMRLGASYRSAIKHDFDGNAERVAGGGAARFSMRTPDVFTWSVVQQLSDQWVMLGDISRTGWKKNQALDVTYANGTTRSESLGLQPTWRVALGGIYRYSENLKLRMGAAYERSAAGETQSVRLPEGRRFWLAFGAQYRLWANGYIDLSYAHQFVKDTPVDTANGNAAAFGRVLGTYDSSADIVAVQYTQGF